MREFTVDVFGRSFCKSGEDTCGDSYKVFRGNDSTVVVLSDGLGSGVKANVLSTLTVEIAGGLASGNLTTHEVVETLISTLPVCKIRNIAYSTFSILRVYESGQATLVEYDSPTSVRLRDGEHVSPVHGSEMEILGRSIRESHFRMKPGDMVMQMSDGIIHAGIGATLRMGWQEEGVQSYLKRVAPLAEGDPEKLAGYVTKQAAEFWLSSPGDDGTVVATRFRKAMNATVLTGPAGDRNDTPRLVEEFVNSTGLKIVCGGTTSHLVAQRLGGEIEMDLKYLDSGLPPMAKLKGVDMVTEGILTLNRVVDYLKAGVPADIENAATRLLEAFDYCDGIRFLVGTARNSAHQNAALPSEMLLRRTVVETIASMLRAKGKIIEVRYY